MAGSREGLRGLALLALLTIAILPAVAGQDAIPGRHQTGVVILAHHPFPDRPQSQGGDPLGFPAVNTSEGPRDRMRGHYGDTLLPTVRVDGIHPLARPDGGSPDALRDAYGARVEERREGDSPAALRVTTEVTDRNATVNVTVIPRTTVASERLVLRLALREDVVVHEGGTGDAEHAFVSRALLRPEPVVLERGTAVAVQRTFEVTRPGVDPRDLAVVAWLQNEDDGAPTLAAREVLQSVVHPLSRQDATLQVDKAVLLETLTATWCDACVPSDAALDLLARAYGELPPDPGDGWRYLRAPDAGGLAMGLVLGGVLLWALLPRGRGDP